MNASTAKRHPSLRMNSIGVKAGAAMAALALVVLAIGGVGLSGIRTLSGAVFQSESTSSVLIAINKAGGSVSEYLLQKDPAHIEAATSTLDAARDSIESLKIAPEARDALASDFDEMSKAITGLASANETVEAAKQTFMSRADALLTSAAKGENQGAEAAKVAERQSTQAIVGLEAMRKLTYDAGRFEGLARELQLALVGQPADGTAPASAAVRTLAEQAKVPLKGIIDLGGSPDLQPIVVRISQSFDAIETTLGNAGLLSSSDRARLLQLAEASALATKELAEELGTMAEAQLAIKDEKNNERSKARVFAGLAGNFAKIINNAVSDAQRYLVRPSDEISDQVMAQLDKSAGFAKILSRQGDIDLGGGVEELKQSFAAMTAALAAFERQAVVVGDASHKVSETVVSVAGKTTKQAQVKSEQSSLLMWGAGLTCLLLTAAIAYLLVRSIARPIADITQSMLRLAGGDTTIDSTFADRKDEIGGMARSLSVFQKTGQAKLEAEAEAARQREAAEEERRRAEREQAAEARSLDQAFAAISAGLNALSQGDLTARVGKVDAKYEPIRERFNASVAALEATIGSAVIATRRIRTGLSEISAASVELARRTERQAANLEETVAALSEVTEASTRTAEGARKAQLSADDAQKTAQEGGTVVAEAIGAMREIEASSEAIDQIIGLIDDIAFQTNLLALNAGVEAARAGAAGQGFAVVAHEVRELSQRSASAAKEIRSLISTSRQQVGVGVERVTASGKVLDRIVAEVSAMAEVIRVIAADARDQSVSLREVSTAGDQMDAVTQESAAMVEETTEACRSLEAETAELDASMQRFRAECRTPDTDYGYGQAA
ncbi:methyl-accepting chemotaxis protein [Jiella mangrovi]|uniref:HAMP domain-containing protein n=1 Tax=Jiella mangrovi TaxID=2821407 RepID=A0ABS4BHZ6_9HYPH|nr:methyl-accepting chemotaxis protein [Jiella mangrovi]MBP0616374.1 HAMP domain-containing protein [Jiella mangrovi]